METPKIQITFLNTIAGPDFPFGLERQAALGLKLLDLKDSLWKQRIEQIDEPTAERVAVLCQQFGFGVDCFSTSIGCMGLTDEAAFRAVGEPSLERALHSAAILRPRVFRLLMPMIEAEKGEAFVRVQREFPWVPAVYREWVDRIAEAGFQPVLENEVYRCLFSSVADITGFFAALERPAVRYIYDVQNLWQNGTFPGLEIYHQLRPLMGALHLKGGRSEVSGGPLVHAAPLEEASWPVLDIVHAVIADGITPVICLNPSHGQKPSGWDIWQTASRDLAYLRREVSAIA